MGRGRAFYTGEYRDDALLDQLLDRQSSYNRAGAAAIYPITASRRPCERVVAVCEFQARARTLMQRKNSTGRRQITPVVRTAFVLPLVCVSWHIVAAQAPSQ